MDTQRETNIIETKNGHKVALKTFLTPREANEIKKITLSKLNYDGSGKDTSANVTLPGMFLIEEELKVLEVTILSIDGKTEGIMDFLQDNMSFDEYQEIVNEARKLTAGLFPQPK